MKTYIRLGLLLSCFFLSCKKQKVVCTGNCYSLSVNGKVVNALTNTNASNVPLIIDQVKFVGLLSTSKNVQEFSSKSDGTFSTAPSIDTTMFQNGYFLTLKVKENNDYMTLPTPGDTRLYDLTTNTFSNVNILAIVGVPPSFASQSQTSVRAAVWSPTNGNTLAIVGLSRPEIG